MCWEQILLRQPVSFTTFETRVQAPAVHSATSPTNLVRPIVVPTVTIASQPWLCSRNIFPHDVACGCSPTWPPARSPPPTQRRGASPRRLACAYLLELDHRSRGKAPRRRRSILLYVAEEEKGLPVRGSYRRDDVAVMHWLLRAH